MIRAGAMAYAILICVFLGIFLSGLLLLQSSSRFVQDRSLIASELLSTNRSATDFFLTEFGNNSRDDAPIDVLNNKIYSSGKLKNWGFYKIGVVSSYFKKDTLSKVYLLGEKRKTEVLALYLTDYSKSLNMVGMAKITGDAKLPRAGIKRGNVFNSDRRSPVIHDGNRLLSGNKLPRIEENIFFEDIQDEIPLDALDVDKVFYNDFSKGTIRITHSGGAIIDRKLKGNIILKSNDSIFVKNNNVFEDIVIEAPTVVFEKGFKGNVQVYASSKVLIQEDCTFSYPSSVYLDKDSDQLTEIFVGRNSTIIGGVVLTGDLYRNSLQRLLTIEENAKVVGDVYCYGKTQLKGDVIGTVYTDRFFLKTTSSIYENYIHNGTINSRELPDYFVRLPFYEGIEDYINYDIIKEL